MHLIDISSAPLVRRLRASRIRWASCVLLRTVRFVDGRHFDLDQRYFSIVSVQAPPAEASARPDKADDPFVTDNLEAVEQLGLAVMSAASPEFECARVYFAPLMSKT